MALDYFDDKELDWKKIKWATFSASEAVKLVIPGSGELFSKGGHTYIKRIAREACTIYNEDGRGFTSFAMRQGKIKEPESFQFLYQTLNFSGLKYFGGGEPVFKNLNPDVGCSPDVLAPLTDSLDGPISFGVELKNPTGDKYFDYLVGPGQLKTQEDLKQKRLDYYTQIQTSIMCYGCDHWVFAAYNEYFPFEKRMIIIEVQKDQKFINDLEVRFAMAVKKKLEWIELVNNWK